MLHPFPALTSTPTTRRSVGTLLFAATLALTGCVTQTGQAAPRGAAASNATSTPDSIAQTSWQLAQWVDSANKPRHAPQNSLGKPVRLDFLARGKTYFVAGFSGCNLFRGSYKMEQGRLLITAPANTRMACPSAADAGLERDFMEALPAISTFTLDSAGAPRNLTLTLASGDTLSFTRGPDPDKPPK